MKKYIKYILLLFCFFSCEKEKEEQYKLYIINNSSETIVSAYSGAYRDDYCIKIEAWEPPLKGVAPKTTSYEKGKGGYIANRLQDTTYISIFNKMDVDTMSCEEFIRKHPIKKLFAVTKAGMEEMNWTLVYP